MAKLGDDVFRTQGYRNIIRLFEAVSEHRELYIYTNSFVTFLSWVYWLDTHAFNAVGHMGALL
jgi:hypothetical protein